MKKHGPTPPIRLDQETNNLLERVCTALACRRDEAIRMALENLYGNARAQQPEIEVGEKTVVSQDELEELLSYL